jgi:predicted amino acid-binding ACT domain protein
MLFSWDVFAESVEYVFGFFQIDISKSSELSGPEKYKQQTKANLRQFVTPILEGIYSARLLSWPGDGGSFLFPFSAELDYDNMVTAALHVQKAMEIFNSLRVHNLLSPNGLSVRISCHEGRAHYAQKPSDMHGKAMNYFLKYERDIGQVKTVTITQEVFDNLKSRDLKKLFKLESRHNYIMGGKPYSRELYRTIGTEPGAERERRRELNLNADIDEDSNTTTQWLLALGDELSPTPNIFMKALLPFADCSVNTHEPVMTFETSELDGIQEKIGPIVQKIDLHKGGIFRLTQGQSKIKIVVDDRDIEHIEAQFGVEVAAQYARRNLGELLMRFRKADEDVPGIAALVSALLAAHNINVVENISCLPDLCIFVDVSDLTKASKVIEDLRKAANRQEEVLWQHVREATLSRDEFAVLPYLTGEILRRTSDQRFKYLDSHLSESHIDYSLRLQANSTLAGVCRKYVQQNQKFLRDLERISIIELGAALGAISSLYILDVMYEFGLLPQVELCLLDVLLEPLKATKDISFDLERLHQSAKFSVPVEDLESKLKNAKLIHGDFIHTHIGDLSHLITISAFTHHHLCLNDKRRACLEATRITDANGCILVGDLTFSYDQYMLWLQNHLNETNEQGIRVPYALECFISMEEHKRYFAGLKLVASDKKDIYYSFAFQKES